MRVVVLGATGAVGSQAVAYLGQRPEVERITVLVRRKMAQAGPKVQEHLVDPLNPATYRDLLPGHQAAVCTLGVGEPSRVSQEEFLKVDKAGPLDFGKACHQAGIRHFELLSSVGISAQSRSFYLRAKGELRDELVALGFPRLSIFHPSMILTPTNRYGWSQGVLLKVWPLLNLLFVGPLRKYRGVRVEMLGVAIAANLLAPGQGHEALEWPDFERLVIAPGGGGL
jgi:uncharacterized protein YbjT (DUF2867 family)